LYMQADDLVGDVIPFRDARSFWSDLRSLDHCIFLPFTQPAA
jgi:hypothetical protein